MNETGIMKKTVLDGLEAIKIIFIKNALNVVLFD
jgi:hypothetical protein